MRPCQQTDDPSNLASPTPPDNLKNFALRCEARALLWQSGDLTLTEAVDLLMAFGVRLGLDTDSAQEIMARAFMAVRDDL